MRVHLHSFQIALILTVLVSSPSSQAEERNGDGPTLPTSRVVVNQNDSSVQRGNSQDIFHKPISSVKTNIAVSPSIETPSTPSEQKLPAIPLDELLSNHLQVVHWAAPGTYHRPLYFEEVNLERYGYSDYGCLQPAASAARFFGTVTILPYLGTLHPPGECQYTLGHYRPGDCAPYRINQIPFNLNAAVMQAGVVSGLVLLIP